MGTQAVRVLVVEDDSFARMDIVMHLEDAGLDVLDAPNSDEAIELLAEGGRIDVVFTDIFMPGSLDGIKLAHYILDRWPRTRVIITSGHPQVDLTSLPGNSMFIAKPYDPQRIAQSINGLFREH